MVGDESVDVDFEEQVSVEERVDVATLSTSTVLSVFWVRSDLQVAARTRPSPSVL